MPQEQLLQVSSHGLSPDVLSHLGRELLARGEVWHLMQMPGVVSDPRQLRVIERPDQALLCQMVSALN